MKKIKEYNYNIKNEEENIIIRSIQNTDLTFYKEWFKNGHIKEEAINKLSEEEIEKILLGGIKNNYTFIIELQSIPSGEIILWNDTTLKIADEKYKKPFYSINVKFYKNVIDSDIDKVFNIFIQSIGKLNIKINSLYILINEHEIYLNNYLENGFKYINKELYKSKLEKFLEKRNIDNPYRIFKMLIKNI